MKMSTIAGRMLVVTAFFVAGYLPGPVQAQSLRWSSYRGSFQQFLQEAQRKRLTAVIDKDVAVRQPLVVRGDLTLTGEGDPVITNQVRGARDVFYLFHLHEGRHRFEGFTIQQHPDGIAFFTEPRNQILWTNQFDRVHVLSGAAAYLSSRGGRWDARRDSVQAWAGTEWSNSRIRVAAVAISVFSQDGPAKYLHLQDMDIENGRQYGNNQIPGSPADYVSHTIYCHPNVSLRFDRVTLKAGNLGLHHFSGGGVPGENRYVELHGVQSPGNGIELQSPRAGGYARIDSSVMGTYTTFGVKPARVYATRSQFRNTGNGIQLRGLLENCTGGAWTGGEGELLELRDCRLDELNFRTGGKVRAVNCDIASVTAGDRGKAFEGDFENCRIGQVAIDQPLGKLNMRRTQVRGPVRGGQGVIVNQ